jgi:hypothetical protein
MLDELTELEIRVGALRVYYPAEGRMMFVAPYCFRMMKYPEAIFDLTPSEVTLLRDKAVKLDEILAAQGR